MKKIISVLLMCLFQIFIVSGQEWEFTNSVYLNDIIEGEYSFYKSTLSPDGSSIAWIEKDNLCIHKFLESVTDCFAWEWENLFMNSQIGYSNLFLQWSPNDEYIAISQDPFLQQYDSDIWIFNTVAEDFTNLTEDNIFGQTFITSENGVATIDYMPLWKSSNELLFFRTTPLQSTEELGEASYHYTGVTLISFSLDTGETNTIIDLSETFLAGYSAGAVSPSGNQVAVIAPLIVDTPLLNSSWGLWLIDIESQDVTLLSAQSDWESTSFPNDFTPTLAYPTSNRSVVWSNDESYLYMALTWATEQNTLIPTQISVNVNDFSTIPIIDYDNLESNELPILFSFNTFLHYQNLSISSVVISSESEQTSLYDVMNSNESLGVLDYSSRLTDGVTIMSQNGNVLVNENTLLRFNDSHEE